MRFDEDPFKYEGEEYEREYARKFPDPQSRSWSSRVNCTDCGLPWGAHNDFWCNGRDRAKWKGPAHSYTENGVHYLSENHPLGFAAHFQPNASVSKPVSASALASTSDSKENKMKPFAVITQSLADPNAAGVISAAFETAEGAKEYSEALIAQGLATLTTKTFRTVIILNTRTGELVGVHVQAPPEVDWAK